MPVCLCVLACIDFPNYVVWIIYVSRVRSLSVYVCMIMGCTLLCAGCPDGFYGDGCQLQCTCRLSSQCMKDSGDCDCDVGYTGQSCTQSEYQWKWNSTSQVNYLTYIAGL